MSVVVKDSGNGASSEPISPGLKPGVFAKVFDLGVQSTNYGDKHQVVLVWEVDERDSEGKRKLTSKTYTASLNEKAKLRQHLESWRGKPFQQGELSGFDLEKLIGENCQLNLLPYTTKAGKEITVINSVLPAAPNQNLVSELPADFCPEWVKEKMAPAPSAESFEDDNIPF